MQRSVALFVLVLVALLTAPALMAQSTVTAVAAGTAFSAAVDTNGAVYTWGANNTGQLGDGTTTDRATPGVVAGITAEAISCGSRHILALLADGTVTAWGDNAQGQLGNGSSGTISRAPVMVLGLTDIVAVSAGTSHSLALDATGRVWAWGANNTGQLGDGSTSASSTPVLVAAIDAAVSIAAGRTHSLALLADGSVRAWGANALGQLGDGSTSPSTTPVVVSGLPEIRSISAGRRASLARDLDGMVWNWGEAAGGAPGATPVLVTGPTRTLQVVASLDGARTALTSDGNIWRWEFSNTPATPLFLGSAPVAVAAGGPHANGHLVSLIGAGFVIGTGDNTNGQLGDGTFATPSAGTNVLTSVLGGSPGVVLATPARQTVRPGQVGRFDITGPPFRFYSIFLDLGPGNTPTPFGTFGLEGTPLMLIFDGLGVLGGIPAPLQLDAQGTATVTGYAANQQEIGLDFWLQVVVYDPNAPMGYILSQTETGRGGGAACRLTVKGFAPSVGEAQFDRSQTTIVTRDKNLARGMNSLPFTTLSRTFFADDTAASGDVMQIEANVDAGSLIAFQATDHRVLFELNPLQSSVDSDSQGTAVPSATVVNTSWQSAGNGNWIAIAEFEPGTALPTNTPIGVRTRLERFVNGVWKPIDTTRGETPPFLSSAISPWTSHSFYLTDERHVVLVHGWGGDEESFGNLENYLETTAKPANRRPVRGYRGDTVGAGFGGRVSITIQAIELDNFLKHPVYGVGTAEPDLVGHSMGGLSIRRWIADNPPTAPGGVLPSVVCLGTPHYGVPCYLINLSSDPGEVDMRRGSTFLRKLARDWRNISPQVRVLDVVGLGDSAGGTDGNGDFLIPGYSATMQANGSSTLIPDNQHVAYYLTNTGHTGGATGSTLFCLSPSGIEYLLPTTNQSHPTYRLLRQFVVDRNDDPMLPDKPNTPNLNRAALWVERPKSATTTLNTGTSVGTFTNTSDPNFDLDIYFFNTSTTPSILVGWDFCPGGTGCTPGGTATLLPGGVYVTP